jgi:hypothetical protein
MPLNLLKKMKEAASLKRAIHHTWPRRRGAAKLAQRPGKPAPCLPQLDWTRMRTTLLALAIILPATARAASTGTLTAEYTGYSHGLTVLKLAGAITLTPGGYQAHVTFHTAGLIGMVVHSDNDSEATGSFAGGTAHPQLFVGSGHLRGTSRATRIEYQDGNPVVRVISPPVEQERTPIPPADTAHTIDTLSALALLIRQVGETGTCAGSATTFDGRRLAIQSVHDSGQETLPQTNKSIFAGPALRCDFDGRQLGGFVRNEDEDALRKPRHGTAWFANLVPGAPPVPVKVAFENKILGQVTLYLTSVEGGAAVASASARKSQE